MRKERITRIMKAKEKILSGIVRGVIKAETYPWPPVCLAIGYQPERPVTAQDKEKPHPRTKNK